MLLVITFTFKISHDATETWTHDETCLLCFRGRAMRTTVAEHSSRL